MIMKAAAMNRRLRLSALAAFCAVAVSGVASAQVMANGDWVSLGDVAPVTGDVGGILLAPAPPPGQTLALDPAFVTAVASGAGVRLTLPDSPILVTRAAPGGAMQAASAPAAPIAPPAPVARATTPSAPVPGHILVLVRDLPRGTIITAADLDWVAPPSPRTVRGAPEAVADIVGMETRRVLKAGAAVMAADFKPPAVIRKGEMVKLVYASPGMRLTVEGQAQADAAAGETVRVLNSYSRRTIEAVAHESGEARVFSR